MKSKRKKFTRLSANPMIIEYLYWKWASSGSWLQDCTPCIAGQYHVGV